MSLSKRIDIFFIIATFLILFISIAAMWDQPPHIDVAWRLYEVKSLLAGKQMYVDFVGPNMPMITFVYTGAIAIERMLGVHEFTAYKVFTFLTIIPFSYLIYHLIKRHFLDNSILIKAVYVLYLILILIWPIGEFGQKEHFTLLFVLPYFLSRNLELSVKKQILIGVCAGIGFGIKPMFLLVPFLVEMYRWIIERKNIFTSDNLTLVIVTGTYYAFILLFFTEYLYIFQIILKVYDAYDITYGFNTTLFPLDTLILLIAIIAYFTKREIKEKHRIFITSLLVGSLGFFMIAILQMKGWINHFYPGTVLASIAGLILLWPKERSLQNYFPKGLFAAWIIFQIAYFVFPLQLAYQKRIYFNSPGYGQFISTLKTYTEGRKVHVFTTSLLFAFPTAQRAEYEPTSSFAYYWMLPKIVNAELAGKMSPGLIEAKRYMFEKTINDISTKQPDLILIKNSGNEAIRSDHFNYQKYFSQNDQLSILLDAYVDTGVKTSYYSIYKRT